MSMTQAVEERQGTATSAGGGRGVIPVTVSNSITVDMAGVPEAVTSELKAALTMTNPKYLENERNGHWNGETYEYLSFIGTADNGFIMPRGFFPTLSVMLKRHKVNYRIIDHTIAQPPEPFTFTGTLHSYQEKALEAIMSWRMGVLQAPTGSGKTVIALAAIAERKQPALVVVNGKELMYQWRDRAMQYLSLDSKDIGLIGDGKATTGTLTIGIVNSLCKYPVGFYDRFGMLVVDECHHTASRTFSDVVANYGGRYMLGLSATPYRRDGLTKVIHFYLGPTVHSIPIGALQASDHVMTAKVVVRNTGTWYDYDDDYADMVTALTEDDSRNTLIIGDVFRHLRQHRGIALVLSDRKAHCGELYERLVSLDVQAELLTGETKAAERKRIVSSLNEGSTRLLVATTQLVGEGFDVKELSSLFLTTPIKWQGKAIQAIGRILRTATGKDRPVIYDYVDAHEVLQSSFRSRVQVYRQLNCEVL